MASPDREQQNKRCGWQCQAFVRTFRDFDQRPSRASAAHSFCVQFRVATGTVSPSFDFLIKFNQSFRINNYCTTAA
jgi:hypothetical protein